MLFDSHAHINSERFEKDRDTLASEIEASDVSYVVNVGWDLESSYMAAMHALKYEWCYAAIGCHPHDAKTMDEDAMILFKGLAGKPKVVAYGEIGLDYYHNHSPRDVQQYWFRRQLQLALDLKMPIIIHDRDANEDVMRILKEEGVFSKARTDLYPPLADGFPDARLLMHCYSGSRELAQQYVKLGATISIAGPVTYKNARRAIEVVEALNNIRLLAETDSPFLTPEPYRGKRNTPLLVKHTVKKMSEIKGISYEEMARYTCENAKRFFGIS
ncbi:MAG: TatD family hydrolase [Anaerovoracaceae bacterium]